MISKLFMPKITNNIVNHYLIGYQHLIVIENKKTKDQIIIDKTIEKLFITFPNIYFFQNYQEMEKDLEILIDYTDENYLVVISS